MIPKAITADNRDASNDMGWAAELGGYYAVKCPPATKPFVWGVPQPPLGPSKIFWPRIDYNWIVHQLDIHADVVETPS